MAGSVVWHVWLRGMVGTCMRAGVLHAGACAVAFGMCGVAMHGTRLLQKRVQRMRSCAGPGTCKVMAGAWARAGCAVCHEGNLVVESRMLRRGLKGRVKAPRGAQPERGGSAASAQWRDADHTRTARLQPERPVLDRSAHRANAGCTDERDATQVFTPSLNGVKNLSSDQPRS